MSTHIEWAEAAWVGNRVEVVDVDEIVDDRGTTNTQPALCIDIVGGSALVIEGTKDELAQMIVNLAIAVAALPDAMP